MSTKKTEKKKSAKKKTTKKVAKKVTKKAAKKATKKAAKKVTTKKAAAKKKTAVKKKAAAKKKAVKATDLKVYEAQTTVGQKVPAFSVGQTGGSTFNLTDHEGKKLVIYFYPKDSTPGCTVEGHDFTRLHEQFKASGVEVFGVSRDSLKSHENFKSKQNYSFELLSDQDEKMCSIFGVIKLKNMYGKQVRGIERSTFLIDEKGHLLKEWRGVKVEGHAEEVFQAVKNT